MMRNIFYVLLLLISTTAFAQKDTIKIMQYNLLNYGNSANPTSFKNPRLDTIINFVKPDIFGANEIGNNPANDQNILDNVLGSGWSMGTYTNTNNEVQTNMLFWKTAKFGLVSQQSICHILRDIIAFKLYYKDTITTPHDTVYLTVIVGHLKASEGTSEETERSNETKAVENYLNSFGKGGNYIFMGDFNLYTSAEPAYQNVVNNPNANGKLNDPIARPGNWHSQSSFADIHTQATRTAYLSDGGVTGGLDDRFDHMLVSDYIMSDSAGMRYLPGTYKAIGQDGQHYNKALISTPADTAAPASVVQALYEMSDHLPIAAGFEIDPSVLHVNVRNVNNMLAQHVFVENPFSNALNIHFSEQLIGQQLHIQLCSMNGTVVVNKTLTAHTSTAQINTVDAISGIYTLTISDTQNNILIKKLLKL